MVDTSILSILALDVYNTSLYSKLNLNRRIGDNIGTATLKEVHIGTNGTDNDGFLASVYTVGNSDVVISYRGTDVNNTTHNPDYDASGINANTAKDVLGGYPTALGFDSSQAEDAMRLYVSVRDDPQYAGKTITLTGQSLGGGLAGYVSALSGVSATVFETMPFVQAAEQNAASYAADLSHITSYAVDGEMLEAARDGEILRRQAFGIFAFAQISGSVGREFDDKYIANTNLGSEYFLNDDSYIHTTYYRNPTSLHGIGDDYSNIFKNLYGEGQAGYQIHGQSLMILDMFGSSNFSSGIWGISSPVVFDHIMSDTAATSIGITDAMGYGTSSDIAMSMIAYSTITSGVKPYGDTAALSLFHDMTVFGSAFSLPGHLSDLSNDVAGVVAAYVMQEAFTSRLSEDSAFGYQASQGILSFGQYSTSMIVSLTDPVWKTGGAAEYNSLLFDATNDIQSSDQEYAGLSLDRIVSGVDQISIGLGSGVNMIGTGGTGTDIMLGTDGSDTINGFLGYDYSNGVFITRAEAISGGDGNDVIYGNGGNDTLLGGAGNDSIYGGADNDVIYGGSGDDHIYANGRNFTSTGVDVVDGGSGTDILDVGGPYEAIAGGVTVRATKDDAGGAPKLHVEGNLDPTHTKIDAVNVEIVSGTRSDDVFYGAVGGTGTHFVGGGGNDVFHLQANDVAVGGSGADTFYLTPGAKVQSIGNNAPGVHDSFHYVMDPSWTTFGSDQIFDQGGDVYLDIGAVSIKLVDLPVIGNGLSSAPWTATSTGNGGFTVHDAQRGIDVFYGASGADRMEISDANAVFAYRSYDPSLSDKAGTGAYLTSVAQPNALAYTVLSRLNGFDQANAINNYGSGLFAGSVLAGTPYSSSYNRLGYEGPKISAFSMAHADASGMAPSSLTLDEHDHLDGVAAFGIAGSTSGGFNLSHLAETIVTGSGNDVVLDGTGDGHETVATGLGNDYLFGRGSDQMFLPGPGNDFIAPGTGSSTIQDVQGFDTLSYYGLTSGVQVLAAAGSGTVHKDGGVDTFTGVERIVGTAYHDVFTGGGSGDLFVGAGGGDQFNLTGVATAVGSNSYGSDEFDMSSGAKVLLMNVAANDVIKVDGVVITGTTHSATYEQVNQSDGSYDMVEHLSVFGSIGAGSIDTTRFHWNASTSSGSTPDYSDPVPSGDYVKLLTSQDVSEIIVHKDGVDTDIYIANYGDGMAGMHFDKEYRSLSGANASGAAFYHGEVRQMDGQIGWSGPYSNPIDGTVAATNHAVMDMFGFV